MNKILIRRLRLILESALICFFTSCASQPEKNESKNTAAIPKCFRYVVDNKLAELKENIFECKNFQSPTGMTTLMMAVAKENNDMAETLMDAGAEINIADNGGNSALIYAANKNNARLVQLLRRHGARIEIIKNNLTGLMMAVRNSSLNLIKVMNPSPKELNLKAEDGWSAIYFAVRRSDPEILNYLLDQGACTQSKDSYDQRPIDFAKELDWAEGVKILKRKTKC